MATTVAELLALSEGEQSKLSIFEQKMYTVKVNVTMVDKIGGSRGLHPPFHIQEHKPSSVTWYEGSLPTEKTAGYLQRLSRLHENLIQSETIQLTKVMNSFPKITTSGNNTARKKPAACSYASAPSLHARKQMEKIVEIDRRRRSAMNSPPPLKIGVKGLEDPIKMKKKSAKMPEPPQDPFDPSNLKPDPIDNIFNMERLRLLDTVLQEQSQTQVEDKKGRAKTRKGCLLTPRRGTEWFITGRYKKEPMSPMREQSPKHNIDRSKKIPSRPLNLSACNSLNRNSARSETKSSNGEAESSIGEGEHSITSSDVGENYTLHWGYPRPKTGGPFDPTANIILATTSTAEANKAETKLENYRPIGTPKSSLGPLEATRSSPSMSKFEDLRKSKVIAAALQGIVDESGDFYQHSDSMNKKRQTSEQSQKVLQNGTLKSKSLSKADAGKVHGPTGAFNEGQPDSTRPDSKARFEVMCMSPPRPRESKGEPIFVSTKVSQPQIKVCYSLPELNNTPEKVSLNKIVRQNELRQRELGNLFEDIKELNRISETRRKPTESTQQDQKD